ncbi:VOC family protein [Pseudomonas zhanjiangensis]|uniref:VOC family protein n=1 Tax=Pseudomonas zhanjiangensis TaxID=3239015 RepID=A0ABV3YTA8_9PSED
MSRVTDQLQMQLEADCIVSERASEPVVKVQALAYLVLTRPDLDEAARFFTDFGLLIDARSDEVIYLRGLSTAHQMLVLEKGAKGFARIGMLASEEDLETLSRRFAVPVQQHPDELGGRFVALKDPDGLVVEVCAGLKSLEALSEPEPRQWNHAGDNKLRLGDMAHSRLQPSRVYKLGHTVHSVASMQASLNWYQQTLGMIVSDFQFLPEDPLPVVAFMRCDCGERPVDHHTFAVATAPLLGHAHSAFELDDLEDLLVGHTWLKNKKYSHSWGFGRHVLGSQIFDYWREPNGDVFEHYVDGDVFAADHPTGYCLFDSHAQHQWGPEISKDITGQNRPLAVVRSVVKRLLRKDDLTLGRIKRLLKAVNS